MFAMVKGQAPLNVREQIPEIMGDSNGVLEELKEFLFILHDYPIRIQFLMVN
tara:strand:+ start:71 stop:226 length:156 start_codon:yes stop_codon:yes gene_type:complete